MLNAIILTTEKAKVYREAFGLDSNGNLFIAISKGGIIETVPCIVFIFTKTGIEIIIDKIKIDKKYCLHFEDNTSKSFILDIHYGIVEKMESLYKNITPEKKGVFKYIGNTMNCIIQNIIQYVYLKLYQYLKSETKIEISRKGINLKRRGYSKIITYVSEYNLSNTKTLVIGVFFYLLDLFIKNNIFN